MTYPACFEAKWHRHVRALKSWARTPRLPVQSYSYDG
jgi:hypothetical protein